MLNTSQLKQRLAAVKQEREERAKMRAEGKVHMEILIKDIFGEKAISAAGKPYDRVICEFRNARGELKDRKAPIFTPEAEFILENLEPGKRYLVYMEKDERGFWRWLSADEVHDEPAPVAG